MEYKQQLGEAEKALWSIFNTIEAIQRTKRSKTMIEIKNIITEYLNKKINSKVKERGDEKGEPSRL